LFLAGDIIDVVGVARLEQDAAALGLEPIVVERGAHVGHAQGAAMRRLVLQLIERAQREDRVGLVLGLAIVIGQDRGVEIAARLEFERRSTAVGLHEIGEVVAAIAVGAGSKPL
jgi:hypothetical protein